MTTLEIVTDELDRMNVFDGKLNDVAILMTKVLGNEVPFNMALTIANYTMSSYVGHFHYKIKIESDNMVPPNILTFILAKSGAKKTSSMLTLEKTLSKGYEIINNHRLNKELELAEKNDATPRPINPLSNALATEAGMIQRLNDFKEEGIGLPAMFVDEISTELATNPDIVPNIKLVAQLFDVGDMKSKPLKDREMQSEEVVGMGMTALFMGSEHGLLENETTLKIFLEEFISKLARRCFFVYPEFKEEDGDFESIDELLMELDDKSKDGKDYMKELNNISARIAVNTIQEDINVLDLDDDTKRLYKVYKIYCEQKSKDILHEALNLELQHRHWKAFKLAGVYAVFNDHETITVSDLKEAINTAERTQDDLGKFINKAKRETYEIMVEHFLEDGAPLTTHEMIKLGWIKKQINLKDMLISANSKLGSIGTVSQDGDSVYFDRFDHIDVNVGINASYKVLPPFRMEEFMDAGMDRDSAKNKAKDERGWQIMDGYQYKQTTFEKLGNLLSNDCAYTPFRFKTKDEGGVFNPAFPDNQKLGIRNKDNIDSGAEFVVLDVDNDGITIDEAYDLLQDYKFVMARSSDKDNPHKFRVIMPIDVIIQVDRGKWKLFMKEVAKHLGVEIDDLPQSQIYYGFKGREVLTNTEGELLEASEIIKRITEPAQIISLVPRAVLNRKWQDRINEFAYAYNVKSGQGLHLALFKAMKHAHDLGFTYEENIGLLDDIIKFIDDEPRAGFLVSLESQRMQAYGKKDTDDY